MGKAMIVNRGTGDVRGERGKVYSNVRGKGQDMKENVTWGEEGELVYSRRRADGGRLIWVGGCGERVGSAAEEL